MFRLKVQELVKYVFVLIEAEEKEQEMNDGKKSNVLKCWFGFSL